MAVLERLRHQDDFTAGERELADYVLSHAEEVVAMTISELAQSSLSSKASIARLCRKLGIRGFRELRVELASDLEHRRLIDAEDIDINRPFAPGESDRTAFAGVARVMRRAIDDTYEAISPGEIDAVARAIRRAGRVLLYAIGDSRITGSMFANMLLKLGVTCHVVEQTDEIVYAPLSVRRGDVALFISYSGSFKLPVDAGDLMGSLRERGCATVFITSGAAPVAADRVVRLPAGENQTDKVGVYYSQECIRFLLNCLYSAIYLLNHSEAARER